MVKSELFIKIAKNFNNFDFHKNLAVNYFTKWFSLWENKCIYTLNFLIIVRKISYFKYFWFFFTRRLHMRMKWRQIQHCFDFYSCTHIPLQWLNYLVQAGALKIKSITNRNSLSKNIEQIRKYALQNSVVGFRCEGKMY